MKLIFLRPEIPNEALEEIITIINRTKGLLRVAVAYFTHPRIAEALIARNNTGYRTRLLINTSDILRPVDIGTEIVVSKQLLDVIYAAGYESNLVIRSLGLRTKGKYQNMHHKFVVSEEELLFGSVNWTSAALHSNFECLVKTDSMDLIEQFIKEFDVIWNEAQELFTDRGQLRRIMCPNCEDSDGVDFESFGPVCTYCGHQFRIK